MILNRKGNSLQLKYDRIISAITAANMINYGYNFKTKFWQKPILIQKNSALAKYDIIHNFPFFNCTVLK